MFKLKRLPNIISISRIVLCLPLIFLKPMGIWSMVLYILAGVTDMIDGPLARRIKDAKSELGAVLDSIADMLLVFVGIFIILPAIDTLSWIHVAYVIGFSFKVLSGFVGYFKHKVTVLLHTYSNKILGIMLFLIPIFYWVVGTHIIVDAYIIFVLASIFVITTEEILINLLLIKPSRNIKSIFGVKKANRETLEEQAQFRNE